MRLAIVIPLACCLSSVPAWALDIRPGLWEISQHQVRVGDQPIPAMQVLLGQMQNLPPEQRRKMEELLAEQGIRMDTGGVRICLTEEQIREEKLPLHDPESGCSSEILERSAMLWRFGFTCPQASGEGETRFVSDREFTSRIQGVYNGQSSSMESQARWIGEDCGSIKSN